MSTITTTSQPATSSPLRHLMSDHPLVAYFVIAFAGTWLFELPLLLAKNGVGLLPFTISDIGFTETKRYVQAVIGAHAAYGRLH